MGCGVNKLIFGITGTEEPEILENFTDRFELCYGCLADSKDLEDGLCEVCRNDMG
jgi:hypothetical protein